MSGVTMFDPLRLRGVTLRSRIGVSPMCQYSSVDGFANEWHLVHLGARATGGAALVMTEATAVEARGRISPEDLGFWQDAHADMLARIAAFIVSQGAVPGMQLAHAGRKASTARPWEGGGPVTGPRGWTPVAPSAIPFKDDWLVPHALTAGEIADLTGAFAAAASRAIAAGFRVLELHAAHGYLAHSFLSPLANRRDDAFGGSFDGRTRFVLDTVRAIRRVMPDALPLFIRMSCTDWLDAEGGWTLEDTIALARRLRAEGVDVIDCSSGGIVPRAKIPVAPGYQVPFAEAIRARADVATAAVGMLTEPAQCDEVLRRGQADLVFLARALLRDDAWPIHAARTLGRPDAVPVPAQYQRAY